MNIVIDKEITDVLPNFKVLAFKFGCTVSESDELILDTIKEYEEMGNEKDNWSFEVKEDENGFCQMVVPNPLDENELEFFYPEEVTSFILSYLMKLLKEKINKHCQPMLVTTQWLFMLIQLTMEMKIIKQF